MQIQQYFSKAKSREREREREREVAICSLISCNNYNYEEGIITLIMTS